MGGRWLATALLLFFCCEGNFVTVASARQIGEVVPLANNLDDLELHASELLQAASRSQDRLRQKFDDVGSFVTRLTLSLMKWASSRTTSLTQCFSASHISRDERASINSFIQSNYGFLDAGDIDHLLNGTREHELVNFLYTEFQSRPDWAQWILNAVNKTEVGRRVIRAVRTSGSRHLLEDQALVQLQGADPGSLSTSASGISDPASAASLPEMLSSVGPPQALSLAEGFSGSSGTILTTSLGSGYSFLTQSDVLSSFIGPFSGSLSTGGTSLANSLTGISGTSAGFFGDSSSSTSVADISSLLELQVTMLGSPGMGSADSFTKLSDPESSAGGSSPGSTAEDAEIYQSGGKEAGIQSSSSAVISLQSSSGSGASQSMNGAQTEAANAATNGAPPQGSSSGDSSLSQSSQSSGGGGGCCGALMFVIFVVGMAAGAEFYKTVLHKYDEHEYEAYLKENIDLHVKQLSEYLALHPEKLAAMKKKDSDPVDEEEDLDLDEAEKHAKAEAAKKADVTVLKEIPLNFDQILPFIVPEPLPEDPLAQEKPSDPNNPQDPNDPKVKARKNRSPGEELKRAQEKMMEVLPKFFGVFYMGLKALPPIVSRQFALHLLVIMVALAMSNGNSSSGG